MRPIQRELLLAMHWDPAVTASRWASHRCAPAEFIDGDFVLSVIQHHVEGVTVDAIDAAGWSGIVSPHIVKLLERYKTLARTRQSMHREAFAALAKAVPEVIADTIVLKGLFVGELYRDLAHRTLSDVDLVTSAQAVEPVRRALREEGYWEKEGLNGPGFFKQVGPEGTGHSHLCIDVHTDTPVKFSRSRDTRAAWALWRGRASRTTLAGVTCLKPDPLMHIVNLVVHMAEDAASWKSAIIENDLRISRLLDIDVLLDSAGLGESDAPALVELVEELDVRGEFLLGLAIYRALRGMLPPLFTEAIGEGGELDGLDRCLALPDATTGQWTVGASERAFGADRSWKALLLVDPALRDRAAWFRLRKGLINGRLDVRQLFAEVAQRWRQ